MAIFEMVKYHKQEYPTDIPLHFEEIAAHFDIKKVSGSLDWSLHTEYSYGKRKFDSEIMTFSEIVSANKDGVPQLWRNEAWALQFADFIFALVEGIKIPKVIEIHPPFSDYTDLAGFVNSYSIFEAKIKDYFPDVEILIENRCGSVYKGGKFIISKLSDISALCNEIERLGMALKIAYDIPQIYTAHNAKTEREYISLLEQTVEFRPLIGGVHLWGKRLSETGRKVSHCGDLTSYFGDINIKKSFLNSFNSCFDDKQTRKMVLEVNSGNADLNSIITDLKMSGVSFV